MSWQAMDAIDRIPYDACRPLEFRVLTKLANVAAQDGSRAFRTKAEMADELGVNERSIQRSLRALEDLQLIAHGNQSHVAHIRPDKRPVVYDINILRCVHWDAFQQSSGETERGDRAGRQSGETERAGRQAGRQLVSFIEAELKELNNSSTRDNQTEPVSPSEFTDAELALIKRGSVTEQQIRDSRLLQAAFENRWTDA